MHALYVKTRLNLIFANFDKDGGRSRAISAESEKNGRAAAANGRGRYHKIQCSCRLTLLLGMLDLGATPVYTVTGVHLNRDRQMGKYMIALGLA